MGSRKFISLCIAFSFAVLLVTGVLIFVLPYIRTTATLHTVFGLVFSLGVLFHLKNNIRSLKSYLKKKNLTIVLSILGSLFMGAYFHYEPFDSFMNFGARNKANGGQELHHDFYEFVEMDTSKQTQVTVDVLRGKHYWHPQMAIWTEDLKGKHLETLFVSKATAKGLFFGGRNKNNFKNFDSNKKSLNTYRRVNALPVWSFNRGIPYEDGMFIPTNKTPLPDAITGATITNNFHLITSTNALQKFKLKIEVNVAFDDNEYYSEFDFPDDEVFHNGTGQLGQPSIVFETLIDLSNEENHYLMNLVGHGHHSAQNGHLYRDLTTLTTAKQIIERIVVGIKKG